MPVQVANNERCEFIREGQSWSLNEAIEGLVEVLGRAIGIENS